MSDERQSDDRAYDIAVVGMAGRFPGAADVGELRRNLTAGVEATTFFSIGELLAAGVDSALLAHPGYVRARPVLADVELFDAPFFGFNPREAQMIDPQQRLFLEHAWHALEDAGHVPATFGGRIGVFAGVSVNSYLLSNVLSNRRLLESFGGFATRLASDKDFLPTRVSYKLDLRGPSLTIQTACSTSLVAVHVACQSLLNRECDLALAGGSTVLLPQTAGYLFEDGGIDSPDGRCRAFDARSAGTLFGSGVGVVILRRFSDAAADGDSIRAVIRGSAINNDGAAKAGFTAPSIQGQAEVIAEALAMAGIPPETVTAVEAHGTATPIGDVIEVAALKKAFATDREGGGRRSFCALGSIKTNFGHLDSAAGVAGLIKAVLELESRQLFPSLHFERPNPELGLEDSPFYVNAELRPWDPGPLPRRIGVSSFGIGGTNAHVVLEEAPATAPASPSRPAQLLVLSARGEEALERAAAALAGHLGNGAAADLADVAFTLSAGRAEFAHRRTVVARDPGEAARALRAPAAAARPRGPARECEAVFLFPGGGAQYPGMARDLARRERVFRDDLERSLAILSARFGLELGDVLTVSGDPGGEAEAARRISRPSVGLPALFAVEHALARLWMSWGVRPRAMLGHSLGEYAAAAVAGVLSLEDALSLVVLRGRLFERLPEGAMLSVALPSAEVRALAGPGLAVAAVNGPAQCVLSGPVAAVEEAAARLAGLGVDARRIRIDVAAHSPLVEPILEEFERHVGTLRLAPPGIPYVSNVTGTWITPEEATSPAYWPRHLRHTVRFADGLAEILRQGDTVLLEVGPGRTLTSFARQQCDRARGHLALPTLRHAQDEVSDLEVLLGALGQAWEAGVAVSWAGFWQDERRRRVPLPVYPFERQRCWIEPGGEPVGGVSAPETRAAALGDLAAWFHLPSFRRTMAPPRRPLPAGGWLVFADAWGLGERVAARLRHEGAEVAVVSAGPRFADLGDGRYQADPRDRKDLEAAWMAVCGRGAPPARVLYLWSFAAGPRARGAEELLAADLDGAFFGLLGLGQALAVHEPAGRLPVWVVSNQLQSVTGREVVDLARATVLGPCRVLPIEQPALACGLVDLEAEGPEDLDRAAAELLAEAAAGTVERTVAYRAGQRWVEGFEPVRLEGADELPALLRRGGVYLITGGLGSMGLAFARYLARAAAARLVLVGRSAPPPREQWEGLLASLPAADPLRVRLAGLLELEAAGAEVLAIAADVADLDQMRAARDLAVERFGAVHGAVHTAGLLGQGIAALKDPADAAAVLAPKVRGALVLDAVLAPLAPDFVLLCSSRSAVAPLPGQVDYCAANAFLDALAHLRAAAGGARTIAVDWGFWQEPGMAARAELPPARAAQMAAGFERLRIEGLADAGVQAFARILAGCTAPQVIVSREPVGEHLAAVAALTAAAQAPPAPRGPRPNQHEAGGTFAAPAGAVAERIAAIWRELLGVDRVGDDDDFFALGGHSLLGTRLLARLKEAFAVEISLRAIFDASTVARLAAVIEAARDAGAPAPAAPAAPSGAVHPLSLAQLRLWYLHRLEPGSTGYNVSMAVRLAGALDVAALAGSFQAVVERHEALRSTFAERAGEPVQVVGPAFPIPLPVADLASLAGLSQTAREEVRRIATRDLQVPFDLARGPLLRLLLLRLGEGEHVLIFELHHIVSDAWSIAVLLREVTLAYEALAQGRPVELPALTARYADFAHWQRDLVEGGGLDGQLAYWRRQLDGLPTLALPLDRSRPPLQSLRGRMLFRRVPAALAEPLRALGRRPETTLFMVLLAACQATLAHWTGQDDVAVGCNLANRERPGTEGLIGFFLNMLVWRTDLSGDPTFLEVLDRVRRVTLDAYAHSDVPFDRLVEVLRPERAPSRHPLFQVKVDFQHLPIAVPRPAGVTFTPLDLDYGRVHNDLTVYLLETGGDLAVTFEYAADLFAEATIAALADRFEAVLSAVAADPVVRLGELRARLTALDEERRLTAEVAFKEAQRRKLKETTRRAVGPLS